MVKIIVSYGSIGVINTAIHWLVFLCAYILLKEQSFANVLGFMAAVTFSFFFNARWTFKAEITAARYVAQVILMGILSWFVGKLGDELQFSPFLTLVLSSATNFVVGFLFLKYFIFRVQR